MCAAIAMRTTVDLPAELYRRAKAGAAVRGGNFNDLVEEGLRHLLRGPNPRPRQSDQPGPPSHDLMRDFLRHRQGCARRLCDEPKIHGGVIPEYQRRGTKSANSAEIPNSSPLTASVDDDSPGFGPTGKGRLSRLRACFLDRHTNRSNLMQTR